MDKKIYLTLENGKVFEGYSFGAEREVVGELVFTTGMTGYIETLTDPSYYGQIVTQTFPLIGNYGVITADMESPKCRLTAYVVREKCDYPSNFRCEMTLGQFLKEQEASENLRRQIKEGLDESAKLKMELSEAKREIFKLQNHKG